MLSLFTFLHSWAMAGPPAIAMRNRAKGDAGQATAEYGLVIVAAAAVALLVLAWAAKTDKIGKLFDLVVDNMSGKVT